MTKHIWVLLSGVMVSHASAQGLHFVGCDHDHGKAAPYMDVHTDVRIYSDWIYDSDGDERVNLKAHAHFDFEFSPVEEWFIRSRMKLEQRHLHDHAAHEEIRISRDRYFDDHVLVFEEVMLVYAPGSWEFFAGKFNPVSGLDQHVVPGAYGYEIEEPYSVLGRIGAGASYQFETDGFGSHRLQASGFSRDTTPLNQTLINGNGDEPDDKEDGGIANTHDFSSWAVSLSGDDLFYAAVGDTIHEVDYVLAYVRQAAGYGAEADEHAAEERGVIGGVYTVTLFEALQVRGVGEYKHIRNHHTHRDEDLGVGTVGLGIYCHGWELGGSHSVLNSNEETDGHHSQVSLGYVWGSGLGVHGGWKSVEEEGEEQKSLGVTISYHGYF